MRKKIRILERTADHSSCRRSLDRKINLDDVVGYLKDNYCEKSFNFLKTQLEVLKKSPRGSRYSDQFKQFALSIFFLGPKAYKKISETSRLPSKTTLQRFARKWAIEPGLNNFIFKIIESRVKLLEEKGKDCFITLDEMSIKSHIFYDISKDNIVGFEETMNRKNNNLATSALVVMVRGIASSWKQPIAYFFYKSTAVPSEIKDILYEIVIRLNDAGLNVLGVVSDQGPNFQKLVRNCLKLTEINSSFYVNGKKLLYFFDFPHLLKSTRNNFFKHTFLLKDGETHKKYLEKLYNIDKVSEFRQCPRLTDDHIFPNNFQKMKVKYASQIFSHSVAVGLNGPNSKKSFTY